MATQATVAEFVERARALCNTPNRNHRKEAENFFQNARSQNGDVTFQTCVAIIVSSLSAGCQSDLAPETLLASQTLSWICKHRAVTGEQIQTVFHLLVRMGTGGFRPKNVLVVQITSALSASFLINRMRLDHSSVGWSGQVVESMFSAVAEHGVPAELMVSYILSVLSTMHEVAAAKDAVTLVTASTSGSLNIGADASAVKALLVAAALLKESATVERTAAQAIALSSSSSAPSTDLFAETINCCTLWVAFAAQTLQTRLPLSASSSPTSMEHFVSALTAAIEAVSAWLNSDVLSSVMACLQAGQVGDCAEACMELCVALCGCVEIAEGGSTTAGHPLEAQLCVVARNLVTHMLPVLSAVLTNCCTELKVLVSQRCDAEQVEAALEKCLSLCRCSAECASALIPRSYTPLFRITPQSDGDQQVVASTWMAYVSALEASIQAFSRVTHTLEDQASESLTAETVCGYRQQCLEVSLSFFSDIAEATFAPPSSTSTVEASAMAGAAGRAIEGVLVASIRAAAYTHESEDNSVGGEEFDTFRNYVRESLRSLVATVPSLAEWLIGHTVQALTTFVQQTRAGVISVREWSMPEALLHALSAVTKHIQGQAKTLHSGELLSVTFQLATLLSSENACCACRPIARMCVVLFAELTPIFLEVLDRLTASGAEAQAREVVALLRAMVIRLVLSLHHPEAPFHPDGPFPACLLSVCTTENAVLFVHDTAKALSCVDLLCLHGVFVPFRVKQDHIGAVSLQKAVAALMSHAVSNPHSLVVNAMFSTLDERDSLIAHLPRSVALLREAQSQMQIAGLSEGILSVHRAVVHGSGDRRLNVARMMLDLVFFHLTSLQHISRADQALSAKSFHLHLHALLACLLVPPTTSALLVQNVGALLAPVATALVQILAQRSRAAIDRPTQEYVSCICRLLGASGSESCVLELSQMLCGQCSLAQLLFILSVLICEIRAACSKAGQGLAGWYYNVLLCAIEVCVPLQAMVVSSAQQGALSLSEVETEGLCELLAACSRIEYLPAATMADPSLSGRATALLLSLQEGYFALMREGAVRRKQLLLPVALVALKSVCSWGAVADVAELFGRIVSEVSEIGTIIAQVEKLEKTVKELAATEKEELNMKMNRERASSMSKASDENRAFSALLQFWRAAILHTVLLPAAQSGGSAGGGGKKNNKSAETAVAKLQLSALGWNTLDCILAQVCRNFDFLCAGPTADQLLGSFCDSVSTWEAALKVITLSVGPLLLHDCPAALDSDGRVGVGALKVAKCVDGPAGEPELVAWLVQSGNADRISRALVFALLESAPAPAVPTAEPLRYFPSELREDCVACLLKLVLVLGAVSVRAALCQVLLHPQCPRNGIVGGEIGAQERVAVWVDRFLAQASSGDWKKFRSAAKTLCRG